MSMLKNQQFDDAFEVWFTEWWHNEGSGIPSLPGEDAETHVRRVSRVAWLVGMLKASELLNKQTK